MGAVKVDIEKGERQLDVMYPIDTYDGVYALLDRIHYVREARFARGDYAACTLLLDLESAIENAGLTERQRQVIDLIFEQDMTQVEASKHMGISQQGVADHLKNAITNIAKYNARIEGNYVYE